MCGIVGYVGSENAIDFLMGGLRRLEYRGYDSAGIALVAPDGELAVCRSVGRIAQLDQRPPADPPPPPPDPAPSPPLP